MRTNDAIWDEILSKLHLDPDINQKLLGRATLRPFLVGKKDLRNLVSMTSAAECATPLRERGMFVLPKSRSEWWLVRGRGYQKLRDPLGPEDFPSRLPIHLTTLAFSRGENPFINRALHSGLLNHFSRIATPLYETISGKHGTPAFSFHVNGVKDLSVSQGTQIELDKGYESQREILLLEAKVGPQETFLIRQLYYPYRAYIRLQELAGGSIKPVRPLFFVADPTESTFTIWEYEWPERRDEFLDYEAIEEVGRGRSYRIVEVETPSDWLTEIPPEPRFPVFQANDLDKIAQFPILVSQEVDTASRWASHYGFAVRQGNYYGSAAAAFGLVVSEEGRFILTPDGRKFICLTQEERDTWIAKRLLEIPMINAVFHLMQERGSEGVGDSDISRIVKRSSRLSGTTPMRRASSIRSYFRWLMNSGTVVVDEARIYSRDAWEQGRGKASP